MSSFGQRFEFQPSQTLKFDSAAAGGRPTPTPTPRPRFWNDKVEEIQVPQLQAAPNRPVPAIDRCIAATSQSVNTTPPSARYLLAAQRANTTTPSTPTSANASLIFARPPPPHPNLRNAIYRTPTSAAIALHNLRTSEAKATYLAPLNGRPTTRGRSPQRTHEPSFPYNAYSPAPATHAAIEARSRATAEGGKEVYALPASQHLFAEDVALQARCGRCLHPLHWGWGSTGSRALNLPSRCRQPTCRALNIGGDWAENEKFRQAEEASSQSNNGAMTTNHLGGAIRYDDLLEWRTEGSKAASDSVDWDLFVDFEGEADKRMGSGSLGVENQVDGKSEDGNGNGGNRNGNGNGNGRQDDDDYS